MRRWFFRILACLLLLAIGYGAAAELFRERSDEYSDTLGKIWLFGSMTSGVFEGEELTQIDPNKPMIALTFDDGPSRYTSQILDILTENGGRATFFMLGERVSDYTETVQKVAQQGSEIGTHTWSHPNLKDLSQDEVRAQLDDSVRALEDAGDVKVRLMRPPYGSVNTSVKDVCRWAGLPMVRWTVDTEDWRTKDAQATYDSVIAGAYSGCIVLCHDIVASTVDAMEMVIPELVRQGYQLVTVSEMFEALGQPLEAGKVYDTVPTE